LSRGSSSWRSNRSVPADRFKFGSNEGGSTFLCKLDKKAFAKCKSPKTYKNLKPGKHKFQVKASDAQGSLDPSPVVKKFTIKK